MQKTNMYGDSIKQWNVVVGCYYDCVYCEKSFRAQMKRQKHNCEECYHYIPHFHPERLYQSLPRTKNDEFIWACSSSDITFAKKIWIDMILKRVEEMPDKTFLFQSKNPECFKRHNYNYLQNTLLDTTIETNRDEGYRKISNAPLPSKRYHDFLKINHPRKIMTIEPVLDFDLEIMIEWVKNINPIRVYIGYDSKNCHLPEPKLSKTKDLIKELNEFTVVKTKLMREAWYYPK